MTEPETSPDEELTEEAADARNELRTIAFRLREIQRLLGVRVMQENRRLEADGIEPVMEHGFYKPGGKRSGEHGRDEEDER